MKDKSTIKKIILDAIVQSLISSLIVFIIGFFAYYFTKEKINISITPSTYINNKYVTVISLKNFQNNKSIQELNLWLEDVEIENIETKLNSTINKNNIKISNIPPSYVGNIIIYSDKEIEEQNLKIELNEKSNINFLSIQKESLYINIKLLIVAVFIYAIEFVVYLYIDNKNIIKKRDELKKEISRVEQKVAQEEKQKKEIQEKLKLTEEEIARLYKKTMMSKMLMEKRLIDYSKELNFWKDTIRKILYGVSKEGMKKNNIFEIVTNNLKTYRTKEKCEYYELEKIIEELKDEKKEE